MKTTNIGTEINGIWLYLGINKEGTVVLNDADDQEVHEDAEEFFWYFTVDQLDEFEAVVGISL